MDVVLPKPTAKPKWSRGDVIVYEGKAFIIAHSSITSAYSLINLATGDSWYTDRCISMDNFQEVVQKERIVTAHFTKDTHRIYIEGP